MKNSENLENKQEIKTVWGWQSPTDCAESVWCGLHRRLLEGNLVFAYRNTNSHSSDLSQCVVVKNDYTGLNDDFSVGVITTGYSMLLPHVPITYLEGELLDELKKQKIDKVILGTYEQIIKDLSNEIISN